MDDATVKAKLAQLMAARASADAMLGELTSSGIEVEFQAHGAAWKRSGGLVQDCLLVGRAVDAVHQLADGKLNLVGLAIVPMESLDTETLAKLLRMAAKGSPK